MITFSDNCSGIHSPAIVLRTNSATMPRLPTSLRASLDEDPLRIPVEVGHRFRWEVGR